MTPISQAAQKTYPACPKSWDRQSIVSLIRTNDIATGRALMAIYSRQLSDEQASLHTKHSNGIGFTAADAPKLSLLAKKLSRGQRLSPSELSLARERIVKYHAQLLDIAAERALAFLQLKLP